MSRSEQLANPGAADHADFNVARRPRLLFLAYFFPPVRSVASVRTGNLARHLAAAGWDVSVVTPASSYWRTADDPTAAAAEMATRGIRQIYTGHRWRWLSGGKIKRSQNGPRWLLEGIPRRIARELGIDESIGWYPEVERACEYLRSTDVDVVLATGGPFGSFQAAQRIARRIDRPYVLDYRDFWSGNPHPHGLNRWFTGQAERQLLAECSAISVISPSLGVDLNRRFGVGHKIHLITNGYNPEELNTIPPIPFPEFAIVYAGQFYPPTRTLEPVVLALRRLQESTPTHAWQLHYYGPHSAHVASITRKHGIAHRTTLHGSVPRHETLAAIRGAGLAVVITSVNARSTLADRGTITGKIFEPIGLRTPVLVIAPSGADVEAVIHRTGGGAVFSGHDPDRIATFIGQVMNGQPPAYRNPGAYAWPRLAKRMDRLLRTTASRHTQTRCQ